MGMLDGCHERTIRRCRFRRLGGTGSKGRFVSLSTPLRVSSSMISNARVRYSGRKLRTTALEYSSISSLVGFSVSLARTFHHRPVLWGEQPRWRAHFGSRYPTVIDRTWPQQRVRS
jgi:hypothetical protein